MKLYIDMRGIHDSRLTDEHIYSPLLDASAPMDDESIARATAKLKAKQAANSVVYYVRIGEVIKIGTTVDLAARMSQLRTYRRNVLATEPGGRDLERKRHLQFANIRIGQREDFTPTLALIRHIEAVRDFHGDPVFKNGNGKILKVT